MSKAAKTAVTTSVAFWNSKLPGASFLRDGIPGISQTMLRLVALAVGWSLTLCVSTYCLFSSALLGFNQPQLSLSFSTGAAITVFTQLALFPRLVKAVGEHIACAMGLTLLSASVGGFSLLTIQPIHSMLYLTARLSSAIADTSTATLVARSSPDSAARARNLALITSTRAGARIFTPVVSGVLLSRSLQLGGFGSGALPYLVVSSLLAVLVPVPLVLKRFDGGAVDLKKS